MKCIRSRITLRRALYLAAAQIMFALIVAGSSHSARADGSKAGDWHGQVQSLAGPLSVVVSLAHSDKGAVPVGFNPLPTLRQIGSRYKPIFDTMPLVLRCDWPASKWASLSAAHSVAKHPSYRSGQPRRS
ncbi:MAG: hypothetical protein LC637_00890 [Xanthomonadaceae bacterium]|nr:hypothetical protein [Xanthomonadaceae bacterium]